VTAEARLRGDILKRIHEDYPRSKRQVLVFGRPAGASTGPGHPDLFGVACGHFLALEIKYGTKTKPTPLQVQHIQDLRMAGAYAWVVRSTLDATRAVYQAKIGGRVPDTTDPIDFDDWFKEITSTSNLSSTTNVAAATTSITEQAEPSTEADSAALDLTLDLEAQADPDAPAVTLAEAQPEKQRRTRRSKNTAATTTPTVDDLQDARDAGLLGVSIQEQADADQGTAYLVELIKAVGDRVTLVYEQGNRIEAKLDKLQVDFDSLLEDEA
jgi:hypothetical protein